MLKSLVPPAGRAERVPGLRELYLQDQVQLRGQHLPALEEPDEGRAHEDVPVLAGGDGLRVAARVLPEALEAPLMIVPFLWLQEGVQVLADVIRPLAIRVELHPLDEAAGLQGAGEQVAGGVVVPHPEGDLDALRVDEVHAAGQRDAGHPAGRGREGGKRRWIVLDVTPRLYIIDVTRRELVVQALHQLIVHSLGHVLHLACLSPMRSGEFEVTPELVERRFGSQGPAVAALCRLNLEPSLPLDWPCGRGRGTGLTPKGEGCCLAALARTRGAGCALGAESLSESIRIFRVWMSAAPLLRLWSLSVPPPAPPAKPIRCEAALDSPGRAHQRCRRPCNCKAAGRCARCPCDSQRRLAGRGQDPGARNACLRGSGRFSARGRSFSSTCKAFCFGFG